MDPGAFGDGVALEVEVLGEGLADEEDAGRVQAHGLLQAGLQVGQPGQVPRGKRVCSMRIQLLQGFAERAQAGTCFLPSCATKTHIFLTVRRKQVVHVPTAVQQPKVSSCQM